MNLIRNLSGLCVLAGASLSLAIAIADPSACMQPVLLPMPPNGAMVSAPFVVHPAGYFVLQVEMPVRTPSRTPAPQGSRLSTDLWMSIRHRRPFEYIQRAEKRLEGTTEGPYPETYQGGEVYLERGDDYRFTLWNSGCTPSFSERATVLSLVRQVRPETLERWRARRAGSGALLLCGVLGFLFTALSQAFARIAPLVRERLKRRETVPTESRPTKYLPWLLARNRWLVWLLLFLGLSTSAAIWRFRLTGRNPREETFGRLLEIERASCSFATDYCTFPAQVGLAGLGRALEPSYLDRMPREDAWGRPIRYSIGVCSSCDCVQHFALISAGPDGRFSERGSRGAAATPPASADDVVRVCGSQPTSCTGERWFPDDLLGVYSTVSPGAGKRSFESLVLEREQECKITPFGEPQRACWWEVRFAPRLQMRVWDRETGEIFLEPRVSLEAGPQKLEDPGAGMLQRM